MPTTPGTPGGGATPSGTSTDAAQNAFNEATAAQIALERRRQNRIWFMPGFFPPSAFTLDVQLATVGNAGAGEDTLHTYDLPAFRLTNDEDAVEVMAAGTFAANANNKRIRLYFGATVILDTTALAVNAGDWKIEAKVWRTGAATQRAIAQIETSNTGLVSTTDYTAPAETLSGAVTIKTTAEATADNDVQEMIFEVRYQPTNV